MLIINPARLRAGSRAKLQLIAFGITFSGIFKKFVIFQLIYSGLELHILNYTPKSFSWITSFIGENRIKIRLLDSEFIAHIHKVVAGGLCFVVIVISRFFIQIFYR